MDTDDPTDHAPNPLLSPPPAQSHPSEAKNKNVEKSLYRLPGGKMGAGLVALPGAHSPQINLHPKSTAQKQNPPRRRWGAAALPPFPPPPRRHWCSEGRQLRQAQAAVDAGVVRARVGQAQGLQEGPAGGLALEGQLGLQVGDWQRRAEATETRGERDEAGAGGPHEQGVGAPLSGTRRFLQRVTCRPSPAPASPLRGSGGPGVGGPQPRLRPPSPSLTCAGGGRRGDGREGPGWLLCWPGPGQPLRRGPGAGAGRGYSGTRPPACPDLGPSAKRRLGLCQETALLSTAP